MARVGRGSLWRKIRQHPGGWSSTHTYKGGAPSRVCGRLARPGVLVTRKKAGKGPQGKANSPWRERVVVIACLCDILDNCFLIAADAVDQVDPKYVSPAYCGRAGF